MCRRNGADEAAAVGRREETVVGRLTPERWVRIAEEFTELRALAADARDARVRALETEDAALAREVAALLEADADPAFLADDPGAALRRTSHPSSSMIGTRIGAYRIEREIGRGGMGVVYEGRHVDPALDKKVAIKTLAIGLDRPELAWRFRRERQLLARLEHPNIASLYDGGATADGVPYLVMEYVDGERLDVWCDRNQLTIPQRLDLFRQVCAAVQFAHSKLIVHRDLKPGNILVSAAGLVKLLDFGIAKLVVTDDESESDTEERTRGGITPLTTAYASPEQFRGEAVTTASDVYSLGVILYRLLTGTVPEPAEAKPPALSGNALPPAVRPPSEGASQLHAVRCGLPGDTALRNTVRGELDAIVMMALRDDPARRYPGADALSSDLLRYLKGMTVVARPDTLGYRVSTFVRRQRTLVTGTLVATIGLLVATTVSMWSARAARLEAARTLRVATVLQQVIGAGGSDGYASAPTLLTVLDSARSAVAAQFPSDALTRAQLYTTFGSSYFNLGRSELSLQLFDSARVLHARVLGATAKEVALDLIYSADVIISLGATDSAFARHRQGVAMLERLHPVPEYELRHAQVELAFNEIALLQDGTAVTRMIDVVNRERASAAPRWDMVAQGEAVMILPLFFRQQTAAADAAFQRATDALAHDSSSSQRHRTALAFLGQSLMIRGRPLEAEPRLRQLLTMTVARLGRDHYLSAQAQNLLAKCLQALDRHQEAWALVDSAIVNNLAAASRDPMYLGEMYLTRATSEIAVRDWAGARRSLASATAQRERLGAQRPLLDVSIRVTTGVLEEAQGDIAAARATLTQAVATAKANLPPGAKNAALAEARLKAFELRHPLAAR
jgi:eukaryotic-like serine/threonine-protein kinase